MSCITLNFIFHILCLHSDRHVKRTPEDVTFFLVSICNSTAHTLVHLQHVPEALLNSAPPETLARSVLSKGCCQKLVNLRREEQLEKELEHRTPGQFHNATH